MQFLLTTAAASGASSSTATESESEPHSSLAGRDSGYETPPDTLPSLLSSGARDYVWRPREMDAAAFAEDEPALHSEGNTVLVIFLNSTVYFTALMKSVST